jgi:hypothetical protein
VWVRLKLVLPEGKEVVLAALPSPQVTVSTKLSVDPGSEIFPLRVTEPPSLTVPGVTLILLKTGAAFTTAMVWLVEPTPPSSSAHAQRYGVGAVIIGREAEGGV